MQLKFPEMHWTRKTGEASRSRWPGTPVAELAQQGIEGCPWGPAGLIWESSRVFFLGLDESSPWLISLQVLEEAEDPESQEREKVKRTHFAPGQHPMCAGGTRPPLEAAPTLRPHSGPGATVSSLDPGGPRGPVAALPEGDRHVPLGVT